MVSNRWRNSYVMYMFIMNNHYTLTVNKIYIYIDLATFLYVLNIIE